MPWHDNYRMYFNGLFCPFSLHKNQVSFLEMKKTKKAIIKGLKYVGFNLLKKNIMVLLQKVWEKFINLCRCIIFTIDFQKETKFQFLSIFYPKTFVSPMWSVVQKFSLQKVGVAAVFYLWLIGHFLGKKSEMNCCLV